MRSGKLVWQIYGTFLLLIILPALVFTWYSANTLRTLFIGRTVASLTEKAYQFGSQLEGTLHEGEVPAADSLCKYLSHYLSTRLTVIAGDGTVLGDSEKNPDSMENHANRSEIIAALSGGTGVAQRYSYTLDEKMLYVAVPLHQNGVVTGVVRASVSIGALQRELRKMYGRIGEGFFLVALTAAFVSYFISRRISGPVNAMKLEAKRFADGDFSGKLTPGGCQEVDELAAVLNGMAVKLRDTIESLREHHNRIDAVLSGMVEGVIALDNEQRIITINDAAVAMFDLGETPKRGTWIGEVLRNTKMDHLLKTIGQSGREVEGSVVLPSLHRRNKGPELHLQVNGKALRSASGAVIGALVVLNDITRIRKLETVRSDFVANVSHELRTPLTSVKGFVETLLAGAIDDPAEARHFLRIISRQVERLTTIVQDLLVLSRIEEENAVGRLELSPVNIRDLVNLALESCNGKAKSKNMLIDVAVAPNLMLYLEPALIEEALINLVDNAISYSPQGARVTVSAQADPQNAGFYLLSVADNGPGIAEEHHERIFERFYRVDKARSRKLGGTGLGLSIVKHITLAHGGTVSLESSPGTGSTFTMHLPGGSGTGKGTEHHDDHNDE